MRAWIALQPLFRQQCYVAFQTDRTGKLLDAFLAGEKWAVQKLGNMNLLDLKLSLFMLPEYNPQFDLLTFSEE